MYPFWIFKKQSISTRNKAVQFSGEQQWLQSEIPGVLPETVGEDNAQSQMYSLEIRTIKEKSFQFKTLKKKSEGKLKGPRKN